MKKNLRMGVMTAAVPLLVAMAPSVASASEFEAIAGVYGPPAEVESSESPIVPIVAFGTVATIAIGLAAYKALGHKDGDDGGDGFGDDSATPRKDGEGDLPGAFDDRTQDPDWVFPHDTVYGPPL